MAIAPRLRPGSAGAGVRPAHHATRCGKALAVAAAFGAATQAMGCVSMSSALRDAHVDLRSALPPAKVSEPASEFDVHGDLLALNLEAPTMAAGFRRELALALDEQLEATGGKSRLPARVRVSGTVDHHSTYLAVAPCLLVLTFLGCPVGRISADLTIDLQIGDRVYSGHGKDDSLTGVYYNNPGLTSIRRAVAAALQEIDLAQAGHGFEAQQ